MNGNIMIVDDTADVLKLLKDILTSDGYSVRPFNNGELALRSALAEAPDLILLDIRMPGMDGFEVCHRIKEDDLLKEIPVIFISAISDVEDKVRAFEEGGVDYIVKPFQKEEVMARVKTHVSLHRSLQEMRRVEEALRKSEESLKMAQAIAHVGHWEWDVASQNVRWSDEIYRIFGYEPGQLTPSYDAFLQAIHPEDRDLVSEHINETLGGSCFDLEFRIIMPDGKIRVLHGLGEVVVLEERLTLFATLQQLNGSGRKEVLGVIQDITERKDLERKLEEEARTDVLTGSATRRYFMELAKRELARVRRYGGEMSLFMLDLDLFKSVNDMYGHHAGDLTLQTLVRVCRAILREEDRIGRLGGEEFAILLPETSRERALAVAERLRQAVSAAEVPLDGKPPMHFTTSIGVATLADGDSGVEGMLLRADQALYEAKKAGRNRVCVA